MPASFSAERAYTLNPRPKWLSLLIEDFRPCKHNDCLDFGSNSAVKTRLRDKALETQNGAVARRFYLSGISNIRTARGIRDRDLHVALMQDFDPLSLQELTLCAG